MKNISDFDPVLSCLARRERKTIDIAMPLSLRLPNLVCYSLYKSTLADKMLPKRLNYPMRISNTNLVADFCNCPFDLSRGILGLPDHDF